MGDAQAGYEERDPRRARWSLGLGLAAATGLVADISPLSGGAVRPLTALVIAAGAVAAILGVPVLRRRPPAAGRVRRQAFAGVAAASLILAAGAYLAVSVEEGLQSILSSTAVLAHQELQVAQLAHRCSESGPQAGSAAGQPAGSCSSCPGAEHPVASRPATPSPSSSGVVGLQSITCTARGIGGVGGSDWAALALVLGCWGLLVLAAGRIVLGSPGRGPGPAPA